MSNPVMNYNQFMAAFKKAATGYSGKGDIVVKDKTGTAKINQEMTNGPVKGKGTSAIDKYTKSYMSAVKSKNSGIRK
jgi:hypothetical protein